MSLEKFSWKDRPALIESIFPVQKISSESYKEQMANTGKALTALGSYWKGRKPLILNKACILGCLMPTSDDPLRDLEIFELLMGMDDRSLVVRQGGIKPAEVAARVGGLETAKYFITDPAVELPAETPFKLNDYPYEKIIKGVPKTAVPPLNWKAEIPEAERLKLEAQALPFQTHRENMQKANRPEELGDAAHAHIWEEVNDHLGTDAADFPELVEQMGMARFGRRPRVADVFSGSGQIPFEAARLGCDVYASDLNPIACMLTWGAFNIVGASAAKREELLNSQLLMVSKVREELDALGIDHDSKGWKAKAYLYCVEVVCPQSGWKVPLLPTFVISTDYKTVARLNPNPKTKSYDIEIVKTDANGIKIAKSGTVQNGEMIHTPDGLNTYRTKISTLRGDHKEKGVNKNRLRFWDKSDYRPKKDDVFQERLYCVQWMRLKRKSKRFDLEIRAVTKDDHLREEKVNTFLAENFERWQEKGYIPDMQIEKGYNTDQPIRERGWTHWHQLYNPRQLLVNGLINKYAGAMLKPHVAQLLNYNSKLCVWHSAKGQGGGSISNVFYNQSLNTLFNYGCRGTELAIKKIEDSIRSVDLPENLSFQVQNQPADLLDCINDLYITDPPYGDAVKYEEITEFFIAWLRKNPPAEFADWTWDSRRALAIKGEDEAFRQGMIAAYRKMAEQMPDNGMQVLMFTHQSGSIWADMANIIWASGLQVTAAWYVVTETDSALRQGANVTGTIMLVLRKRLGEAASFRDDLGWEIAEAVKQQIEGLTGLDQQLRDRGSEPLYTDADLQMAGYAAALKVLTSYSQIDGKDMVTEAEAPKTSNKGKGKGKEKAKQSFVEELIDFAVQTAVQFLVPVGFEKSEWQKLAAMERFYLKMAEMEHLGEKSLDNYQNFSKAFKVSHFDQVMSEDSKANNARLKLSTEFKNSYMSGDGELPGTPLRAVLYALYELSRNVEVEDVLAQLNDIYPAYLQNKALIAKLADYLATKRAGIKKTKTYNPEAEAKNARILAEAIKNQKL